MQFYYESEKRAEVDDDKVFLSTLDGTVQPNICVNIWNGLKL
jgi:hypothetical protein